MYYDASPSMNLVVVCFAGRFSARYFPTYNHVMSHIRLITFTFTFTFTYTYTFTYCDYSRLHSATIRCVTSLESD
jgi:hypothetical protein